MGCKNSSVVDNENFRGLLGQINFGPYKLRNKIMMAAMTRCKTDPKDGIPNDALVKYYTQRGEDAGIVLTECSAVRADGEGFPGNAQAFNKEQYAGWKKVVDAVHKVGGKIFIQLYHCGRATTQEKINGATVVGPSDIKNRYSNNTSYDTPTALDKEGIKAIIEAFGNSAKLAKEVGFDGVEIHAANGYLVDQFLKDAVNNRTDEYGGSIQNRCKFLFEVIDEVCKVFGANRVGVKLTPVGRYNDMYDSNPEALLEYLLPELDKKKICFIELCRAPDGTTDILYEKKGEEQIADMYNLFGGVKNKLKNTVLVGNCKFTPEEAEKMIKEKKIDMVSFATNYIANPDLARRIRNNYPLAQPDWSSVFAPGEKGYNDYPKYSPPVVDKKEEEKEKETKKENKQEEKVEATKKEEKVVEKVEEKAEEKAEDNVEEKDE